MKRIAIAMAALSLVLAACDPAPDMPSKSTAMAVAKNLRYVKDAATDLCYAVLTSQSMTNVSVTNLTITWVPCDAKVLKAIAD
jgi:hypothetical protein